MDFTKLIQSNIHPKIILDIGANVGEFAIQSKMAWPDAYIFSIEANPNCEPYLKRVGNPFLIQALSSENKTNVPFYTTKLNPINTGNSLYKETCTNLYDDNNCVIKYITTSKLDDLFDESNDGCFNLIKIDTQGSEIDIIKGGINLIKKSKWILLEVSIISCNENSILIDDVIKYMTEIGFDIGTDIENHIHENKIVQKDILFKNLSKNKHMNKIEQNRHSSQMGIYKNGLQTDGLEYEILYDAAQEIKGVNGFTCELGVRCGGSSAMIIQSCIDNDDKRIHVGIDPYGNIEFSHPWSTAENKMMRSDWTNKMKQESLPKLFQFCNEKEVEFLFFNLESTEFFKRFSDGIPVYNEYKRIINQYAFVFFDAPPSPDGKTKIEECEFFQSRTPIGGVWVFDDVGIYQHDNVHQRLINEWGFEIFQKGWKWSYKKTK